MKNPRRGSLTWTRVWRRLWTLSCIGVVLAFSLLAQPTPAKHKGGFSGATSSQPLALSADGELLAVANPDNNTVTFFDTARPVPDPIEEVNVGREPNGVALAPDGSEAYVANAVDGTVSVLRLNGRQVKLHKLLQVGTEPYGVAVTPNGDKVYVTNARSNSVTVINARNNHAIKTIEGVGIEPRGLAITNDGDGNEDNETVFVTQFLALPVPGKIDGADDAKAAFVTMISTATDSVIGQIALNPIADTAFKPNGDEGYVLSAASNIAVKVAANAATGAPAVLLDPKDATRVLQIPTGSNPRGIVINAYDTRAYVMNYISRDVTVIDLLGARESVIASVQSAPLPLSGTLEDKIHVGNELYNTSIGAFDPATPGGAPITRRLSN